MGTPATLADLLKFKKEISLIEPETNKVLKKVWIRILGDEDLKNAYSHARIASAKKRNALKNKESLDYQDAVAQIQGVEREYLNEIIVSSKNQDFAGEASVVVEREELPKIEEISTRPDAPVLEDQEKLDALIAEQDATYEKKINEFIETKNAELKAELDALSEEEVMDRALDELINIQALETFMLEINDQKGFRGTFVDEPCKIRGYDTIDDFKNAASSIKSQIITAYDALGVSDKDLKN